MFPNFNPLLFDDTDFKEDAVREVIIAPILARLGYSPSGEHRVVRSKTLKHPFIYAGTRKLPINLIPDYTLMSDGRAILVLDAKQPRVDVLSREAVQQVYSYAIHPDIKLEHFALCNGRKLVVFHIDKSDPIFSVDYENFDSDWSNIISFLSPKFLKEPKFRRYAPDYGCALARLGLEEGATVTLFPARFNSVARLDEDMFTASANVDFLGKEHCVSFDFDKGFLVAMLECLPEQLFNDFSNALKRAPFQAAAELAIELDLHTRLGPEVKVEAETFRPLIVQEVVSSRFDPSPLVAEITDIPPNVYRLRNAFKLAD